MIELEQTRYLRRRLDTLDGQLAQARHRLRSDDPEIRIDARGDIEVLERRSASLKERIREIESDDVDTVWERMGAAVEEDVALLEDDLKRWMDGLDELKTRSRR